MTKYQEAIVHKRFRQKKKKKKKKKKNRLQEERQTTTKRRKQRRRQTTLLPSCLLSLFLHPKKTIVVESACVLLFGLVFRRFGEYNSLDLYSFVNLTTSCSLIPLGPLSWGNKPATQSKSSPKIKFTQARNHLVPDINYSQRGTATSSKHEASNLSINSSTSTRLKPNQIRSRERST